MRSHREPRVRCAGANGRVPMVRRGPTGAYAVNPDRDVEDELVAYDEALAERVREVLAERMDVTERRMFGGLAFMVGGHMACGITGTDLMVRVGRDGHDEALEQPHAREMDFTGRPMTGYVHVDAQGTADDASLEAWVRRGVTFVVTLPPKAT